MEHDEHQPIGAGDAHPLTVEGQSADLRVVEPHDTPSLAAHFVPGPELSESGAGERKFSGEFNKTGVVHVVADGLSQVGHDVEVPVLHESWLREGFEQFEHPWRRCLLPRASFALPGNFRDQGEHVGEVVVVEIQDAGDGFEHLQGRVPVAAPFQPQVLICADPGKHGDFLPAEPGNTPQTTIGDAGLLRSHQIAPGPQERRKSIARFVHVATLIRSVAFCGGPVRPRSQGGSGRGQRMVVVSLVAYSGRTI